MESKPAEEQMEVEDEKPSTEELKANETNTTESSAPNNADPSSTSQEAVENESTTTAVAAPAETKPVINAGGDSSAPSAPVNETKGKSETKDKKQKVDLSKAPVRQYLDTTVVPVLLGALSALARERPQNPIEYLGNYLLEKSKELPTD
uniref:Dpy-30 protein n=1 Tax=Coptotermes formosanus TaxID=36987 RepID=R4ULD0_COPFO|nr:Dpy-30 protein [Coptotermes formosanus]